MSPCLDTRRKRVTFVNSKTLARDRTLIGGEDAGALAITFLNNSALLVIVSCGLSTRAFA